MNIAAFAGFKKELRFDVVWKRIALTVTQKVFKSYDFKDLSLFLLVSLLSTWPSKFQPLGMRLCSE